MYSIEDVDIFYDGLDHPECVAIHPDGSVWAGGEAGQVYRIDAATRKVEEVCNTGGFTLGIAFSPDCSWLAICDLKQHCIWKMDMATRSLTLFADEVNGEKISIPNYPVFDDAGNVYVSDSGGFRQITGRIYRFDANGAGMVWHAGPFNFANGMALSPDRKYLYVVCSWLPGVERVRILGNGDAGDREVYVKLPKTCPDGIAFDASGNCYVCCYTPNAIFRITPDRSVETVIEDWEAHTLSNPTNIAFGGAKFNELFFANLGRWHIGRLPIDTPGLPLPCHR